MKILANIFIGLTALIHILFFKLESIDFMKPEVLAGFNLDESTGIHARIWAFNQGFYNLFFALGLIYSLFLLNGKNSETGKILAYYVMLSLIGAGLVLYLSVPEKFMAAMVQGVPPILGIVFLHLHFKRAS